MRCRVAACRPSLLRGRAPHRPAARRTCPHTRPCRCLTWWTSPLSPLQAGANIDLASRSGYTPLHLAAFRGSADCVRVLLAAGARPELRSRRGSTATHFAAQQPCTAVLEQVRLWTPAPAEPGSWRCWWCAPQQAASLRGWAAWADSGALHASSLPVLATEVVLLVLQVLAHPARGNVDDPGFRR